jgi:tetratricopeptide (TPR) repeat protein
MLGHSSGAGAGLQAQAFAAVWAADDDRALALLHNGPWPGSGVLRARIYARKGLIERVLIEYRDASAAGVAREERADLATLAATVLAARGRRVEAILALHDADTLARQCAGDVALHAQYLLALGSVELSSGHIRDARDALDDALEHCAASEGSGVSPHRLELEHVRARALEMRAQLHALTYDYSAQLDDLRSAIAAARLARNRDRWHEAALLATVSGLVGTFPEAPARLLFTSMHGAMRWNSHLDEKRAIVRFNLARAAMLFDFGDPREATAGRSAPSLAARLACDVERLLYDAWNDDAQYLRELEFASSLARTIDWEGVRGEEILGLATLALLLVPHDLDRALAVKALYDATLPELSREAQSFLEPRRIAFDDLVAACIAKAEGDAMRSLATLDDCVAFWTARGMSAWRAIAALERYPLSGDATDLEPARLFVREHPGSRFSRRLRSALAAVSQLSRPEFPYLRVPAAAPVTLGRSKLSLEPLEAVTLSLSKRG